MNRAIELDHEALHAIVAVLWRMAGFGGRFGHGQRILRSVHRAVTRLLRPAEAAARRLILVLARGIAATLPPAPVAKPNSVQGLPGPVRRPSGWRPFALAEPMPRFAKPRPWPAILPARGDSEIDGSRLAYRLDALCHALDDLRAQAGRLARWQARRKRARAKGVFCAIHPLRPGPPLDLRGRAARRLKSHELFGILTSAHRRAWWAFATPPDTS